MEKRSVSIAGHRTSISLEPAFWTELGRIACEDDRSVSSVIAEVDRSRMQQESARNLSSSLRIYVLERLKAEKAMSD